MKIDWTELTIPGCYVGGLTSYTDYRGSFQKLFNAKAFESLLHGFMPRECYLTSSAKGVVRGMHFQLPPDDHAKIVICLGGKVTDVLLDLRQGPTYGNSISVELSAKANAANAVLLPKGIAHGFYAHSDASQMMYLVETEHSPENDRGIKWDSFGYSWPINCPILSERDKTHPPFNAFMPPEEWKTD